MAEDEDRVRGVDQPASAAIGRMFDKAAEEDADLASLVDLLRDAYQKERWNSRDLTRILEQASGEGAQR